MIQAVGDFGTTCSPIASSQQGRHVILFRVQGKTLQIVRILHSAMDFPSQLKGNE